MIDLLTLRMLLLRCCSRFPGGAERYRGLSGTQLRGHCKVRARQGRDSSSEVEVQGRSREGHCRQYEDTAMARARAARGQTLGNSYASMCAKRHNHTMSMIRSNEVTIRLPAFAAGPIASSTSNAGRGQDSTERQRQQKRGETALNACSQHARLTLYAPATPDSSAPKLDVEYDCRCAQYNTHGTLPGCYVPLPMARCRRGVTAVTCVHCIHAWYGLPTTLVQQEVGEVTLR